MSKTRDSVFIWVDYSEDIGFGHVSRCLSLAKILSDFYEIVVVSRNAKTSKFFSNIKFIKISDNNIDAPKNFLSILGTNNVYLTITDVKYTLDEKFFYEVKKLSKKFICIENISKGVFNADMLLFPSLHYSHDIFDKKHHHKIDHSKIFYGPDWVIIREELENYKTNSSQKNNDIVVTTGGTDPNGIFFVLWEILKKIDISICFLIGEKFKHKNKLPDECGKLILEPFNLDRINNSSIIISSFGVSIVESLYLKKKVIGITHHSHDHLPSKNLSFSIPSYFHLGDFRKLNVSKIKKQLSLAEKYNSSEESRLIDGKGKSRILDWIRK